MYSKLCIYKLHEHIVNIYMNCNHLQTPFSIHKINTKNKKL